MSAAPAQPEPTGLAVAAPAPTLADLAAERLTAGALTLRPWEPSDVAWVFDACQDPEIQRGTRVPSPYRATDALSLLERSRAGRRDGSAYRFAVVRTDTDELLGAVSLTRTGPNDAEVGGWVAWGARRQGVAVAAVEAAASWALARLGVRRVWLSSTLDAVAAQVAERAGFRPGPGASYCRTR